MIGPVSSAPSSARPAAPPTAPPPAVAARDGAPEGVTDDTGGTRPLAGPYRGRRLYALLAGLTGLVAVVCALALPFAPLSVNAPTVSWPRDPARPEPTLLNLP